MLQQTSAAPPSTVKRQDLIDLQHRYNQLEADHTALAEKSKHQEIKSEKMLNKLREFKERNDHLQQQNQVSGV